MKKLLYILLIGLIAIACSNNPVTNNTKKEFTPHQVGAWYLDAPHHGVFTGTKSMKKVAFSSVNTTQSTDTLFLTSPTDQHITIMPDSVNEANFKIRYAEPNPLPDSLVKRVATGGYMPIAKIVGNFYGHTLQARSKYTISFTDAGYRLRPAMTKDSLIYTIEGYYNPTARDTIPPNVFVGMMDTTNTRLLQGIKVAIKKGLNQVASQIKGLPNIN